MTATGFGFEISVNTVARIVLLYSELLWSSYRIGGLFALLTWTAPRPKLINMNEVTFRLGCQC